MADASSSRRRSLVRMVRKCMFHFVDRKMKIQEDTFHGTRRRGWDQFQPATANGQ